MDAGFAADFGAGVLFFYGNDTVDVMNFGMAADGPAAQGITEPSFVVTDDIASAPPSGTRNGLGSLEISSCSRWPGRRRIGACRSMPSKTRPGAPPMPRA